MIYGHTYNDEKSKGYSEFKFKRLSDKSVQRALEIVHLSDQIIDIQRKYVGAYFIKIFILINYTVICSMKPITVYSKLHNHYGFLFINER